MVEIRFDKANNRLVLTTDNNEEILISPQCIRDLLPTMSEKEKIEDLEMILHDIEREKLTKMENYIKSMRDIQSKIESAREKLISAPPKDVKKWDVVIKSYIAEKNALAEIRRAVGLLEKDKKTIRIRIARLETQSELET